MAFNFLEVKRQKDKNIFWLLFLLCISYTTGLLLIWYFISVIYAIDSYEISPFHSATKSIFQEGGIWIILIVSVVAGLISWLLAGFGMGRLLAIFRAYEPELEDRYHKQFVNIIDEVKLASGINQIRPVILPDSDINAFACQDFSGRIIIGVTEGALAKLTRQELEAVVAHEMGHIMAGDLLSTSMFSAVMSVYSGLKDIGLALMRGGFYLGADYSCSRRRERDDRDSGGLFFIGLAIFLIAYLWSYLNYFLITAISRQREYRADTLAIKIVRDPISLARALLKIKLSYKSTKIIADKMMGALFISNPFEWDKKGEGMWDNLFSTHPPLEKRIEFICNIASINPKELEKSLIEEERTKQQTRVMKSPIFLEQSCDLPGQSRWFVFKDGNWIGPYSIVELASMGLSLETFVRQEGQDSHVMVSDVPILREAILLGKLPGGEVKPMCPRCKDYSLLKADYEGAIILACPNCLGYLVEREQLKKILERREMGFSDEIKEWGDKLLKMAKVTRPSYVYTKPRLERSFPCPVCRNEKFPMIKKRFSEQFQIEIDVCGLCARMWFDAGELEVLQYLVEKLGEERGLSVEAILSQYTGLLGPLSMAV